MFSYGKVRGNMKNINAGLLLVATLFLALPISGFSGTLHELAVKFGRDIKNPAVKIVVMDFSLGETGNKQDSFVVRERMTTYLVQNKNTSIIERALLEKVLQEQKIQISGAVSADSAKKIGELTGADVIVSGTLSDLSNNEVELNARIIDLATGKVISAGQATFKKDWKFFNPPVIDKDEKVAANSAQDYYRRGVQYYTDGKYSMALEFYSKAIKLKSDYLDAYNARGQIYSFIKGKNEEAISDFSRAIELKIDSVEAYSGRAMAYSAMGNYDKAIQDYDRTIELTPACTTTISAEEYLDSFVPYAPDYIGNYIKRGNAYLDKKEPDMAIRDYTKIIELRPTNEYFYTLRGAAYRVKGDYSNAILDYTSAIMLSSNTASNYSNRGDIYYAKGDFEAAIKDYTKVISLFPKRVKPQASKELPPLWEETQPLNAGGETYSLDYVREESVYINRGNAYFMKADYNKAIADYSEAIELETADYSEDLGPRNPGKSLAYSNRGNAYLTKGEVAKAVSDCEKAISLDPSNSNAVACREAAVENHKK